MCNPLHSPQMPKRQKETKCSSTNKPKIKVQNIQRKKLYSLFKKEDIEPGVVAVEWVFNGFDISIWDE